MGKVYTSAAVIIPPKEKWGSIQEIRRIYDRQIDRWMPHITLLYPFRHENQFNKLANRFSTICGKINPFKISLGKFKYFEHRYQNFTIWLDPQPNNAIIKLQSEILKLVPDCNDVNKFIGGFNPHLSVGQIQGTFNLKNTLRDLQDVWEELKFEVKEIFFISRNNSKKSRFTIKKTIPLKL
ncbi:MAG: 2'-5' RNA ligase family protein [Promethearchaeota archaeon]